MVDPITPVLVRGAEGALLRPAIGLVTYGAVTGWRKIQRSRSPTILIAWQNNSGKTTLCNYSKTGRLPNGEQQEEETQGFESTLVEMTYESGHAPVRNATFWITDSRGFFDSGPLVQEVRYHPPVFIFYIFDVRRILDPPNPNRPPAAATMKYEDVKS
jgi:hypothetical protein